MVLMMLAMSVSATAQMKAYSPPEQDIGHYEVATLSVDGQAVVSFDSQWNIVDLQTPVMLNMEVSAPSAQVQADPEKYGGAQVATEDMLTPDMLSWTLGATVGIKYSKQFALNKQAQKVKYVATDIVAEEPETPSGGGDNNGGGDNPPSGELEG